MTANIGLELRKIRGGLRKILSDICGFSQNLANSDRPVDEGDVPFTYPDPTTGANLKIKLIASRSLGLKDEIRTEYDEALDMPNDSLDGGFQVTACGNRLMSFSITVETWDTAGATAAEYVEHIVSSLALPSILERLKCEALCSFSSIQGRRDLSYMSDGQMISAVGFDLIVNCVSNLDDDPITTIRIVDVPEATIGGTVGDI